MARANLTYEEVKMIKEMLSWMVIVIKRWPDKVSMMDVISKLEKAEEECDD